MTTKYLYKLVHRTIMLEWVGEEFLGAAVFPKRLKKKTYQKASEERTVDKILKKYQKISDEIRQLENRY